MQPPSAPEQIKYLAVNPADSSKCCQGPEAGSSGKSMLPSPFPKDSSHQPHSLVHGKSHSAHYIQRYQKY